MTTFNPTWGIGRRIREEGCCSLRRLFSPHRENGQQDRCQDFLERGVSSSVTININTYTDINTDTDINLTLYLQFIPMKYSFS